MKALRIGTRSSSLALIQAQQVANRLQELHPGLAVELVPLRTTGDSLSSTTLPLPGGKGLFTDAIEAALLEGDIDLAVHSLKDLPCELPQGLAIGAYCQREDPRDVLICKAEGAKLDSCHPELDGACSELDSGGPSPAAVEPQGLSPSAAVGTTTKRPIPCLPPQAQVGTSSLRRTAQLLSVRPDLRCVAIRGNIDTRLRKLDEDPVLSALIVAAAGVHRLGLHSRITCYLDEAFFLPAPGQGVIAIEIATDRADSATIQALIADLNHQPSELEARAERSFLQALGGGCQVPLGALATYAPAHDKRDGPFCQVRHDKGDGPFCQVREPAATSATLNLSAMVASLDGSCILRAQLTGSDPDSLGKQAAEDILAQAAATEWTLPWT
ncbi:MAG: hydroxymethylbilane synthase [Coriobacteriia bacterium]|nr:hydroxymethylbilane synthase [Coriobacteriia bacterium]